MTNNLINSMPSFHQSMTMLVFTTSVTGVNSEMVKKSNVNI